MTRVIVERSFAAPVNFAAIQALEDAGAWCLQAHQVTFARTLFATDRRRMLCVYSAPDAEAVRRAQEQAHMPFDVAWACMRIDPFAGENAPRSGVADAGSPNAAESSVYVAIERLFPTPITAEEILHAARNSAWCFETYRAGYVESHLSLDGSRLVCLFAAPDVESVRIANRTLGFPVERLWPATLHDAPPAARPPGKTPER